jgi:hypothetical protein
MRKGVAEFSLKARRFPYLVGCAEIAQSVEHRSEKPGVASSILALGIRVSATSVIAWGPMWGPIEISPHLT